MVFSADFKVGFCYLENVAVGEAFLKSFDVWGTVPVIGLVPVETQTDFLVFCSLCLQDIHFIINHFHLQEGLKENLFLGSSRALAMLIW